MREKAAKANNLLSDTIKIQTLPIFPKIIVMTFQFENGDVWVKRTGDCNIRDLKQ